MFDVSFNFYLMYNKKYLDQLLFTIYIFILSTILELTCARFKSLSTVLKLTCVLQTRETWRAKC